MEDVVCEIKDKRSKWKKLKLFTSTALNSKVRPYLYLESSIALIYESGTNQEESYVKKKCTQCNCINSIFYKIMYWIMKLIIKFLAFLTIFPLKTMYSLFIAPIQQFSFQLKSTQRKIILIQAFLVIQFQIHNKKFYTIIFKCIRYIFKIMCNTFT